MKTENRKPIICGKRKQCVGTGEEVDLPVFLLLCQRFMCAPENKKYLPIFSNKFLHRIKSKRKKIF